MIERPFTNVLFPLLQVSDYEFKFPSIEEKNELADIQILREKVEVVIQAANAEMDAELTDEGEVKVSGKPVKQEIQPFGQQELPRPEQAESPIETTTKSERRYTVIAHDDDDEHTH
jgi:hypothetical protein